MKIQKLLRQFGEHGNDYSLLEVGDRVNEIIDLLYGDEAIAVDLTTINLPENIKIEKVVPSIDPKNRSEFAARSPATADKVYLIKDGKKHWIKNPETLQKLGFNFSSVKNISNEEMNKYETADSINLKETKVLKVDGEKEDGFDKYNI